MRKYESFLSLFFIRISSEHWPDKQNYTDVKTNKNGNENFPGGYWKTHTISFKFQNCRMLTFQVNIAYYESTFLSTECKPTNASTEAMHGRLEAVIYQIRLFCVFTFFSNLFSYQMLLLFLASYWIEDYSAQEHRDNLIFLFGIILNPPHIHVLFQLTSSSDKYYPFRIKKGTQEGIFFLYSVMFWKKK